jgi:hypothetical protein
MDQGPANYVTLLPTTLLLLLPIRLYESTGLSPILKSAPNESRSFPPKDCPGGSLFPGRSGPGDSCSLGSTLLSTVAQENPGDSELGLLSTAAQEIPEVSNPPS